MLEAWRFNTYKIMSGIREYIKLKSNANTA